VALQAPSTLAIKPTRKKISRLRRDHLFNIAQSGEASRKKVKVQAKVEIKRV
jgi:hypothetical protein